MQSVSARQFQVAVSAVALVFTVFFCLVVVPPLIASQDLLGGFAAGFVNPFAAGYSVDVIACWVILAVWVVFEAKQSGIRHGWICLVVGIIPGVAVGLAAYLVLRSVQLGQRQPDESRTSILVDKAG
jgi:uncharacterized membrane protein